jgi:hypothetical protein
MAIAPRGKEQAEDVCYEVDMLVALADFIPTVPTLFGKGSGGSKVASVFYGAAAGGGKMSASTVSMNWSAQGTGWVCSDTERLLKNASVESFLIHFRCLAEFFVKRNVSCVMLPKNWTGG